jgi:SAM-dependent methyltransferase
MREAPGLRVLEIGSQSWEWCLARYGYRPEQLTCINISQTELENGREQAAKLGVSCDFHKKDAHDLEFADGSFDMVFGVAILHHLEFARALCEIQRVLRDSGRSCSWGHCGIIRLPAWCAGSRITEKLYVVRFSGFAFVKTGSKSTPPTLVRINRLWNWMPPSLWRQRLAVTDIPLGMKRGRCCEQSLTNFPRGQGCLDLSKVCNSNLSTAFCSTKIFAIEARGFSHLFLVPPEAMNSRSTMRISWHCLRINSKSRTQY